MTEAPERHAVFEPQGVQAPRPSLYASYHAHLKDENLILRCCIAVLLIALVSTNVFTYKLWRKAMERTPWVLAMDQNGDLHPVDGSKLRIPITDDTVRQTLAHFLRAHLERRSGATVREDYNSSLKFMTDQLSAEAIKRDRDPIMKLIAGDGEEVRIDITQIALSNTEQHCANRVGAECQATITSEKTVYRSTSGQAIRKVKSTVDMTFSLNSYKDQKTTSELVKIENVIGLLVSRFHEYEAFLPAGESGQ